MSAIKGYGDGNIPAPFSRCLSWHKGQYDVSPFYPDHWASSSDNKGKDSS